MLKQRVEKVLKKMKDENVPTLILCPSSNMSYVLGHSPIIDERLFVLVLSCEGQCFVLANSLYEPEVAQMFEGRAVYWRDGENAYSILADELAKQEVPLEKVAVDDSMQARFLMPLMALFPKTRFVSANSLINDLRIYKDEAERKSLRQACSRADAALKNTIGDGSLWRNKTEADFFAQLSYEMTKLGIKEPGACICSGANAANPHYVGGKGIIENGKCLLVDFGGTYEGYYTDMTRTFHFGEPDPEFVKIHEITLRANLAAQSAAHLGNQMQDVDRAARAVIKDAGYGEYFLHRTGHGIGIDVHEYPNAVEGETAEIMPGMAFSIEPGIYLSGRFGVRIEDEALMTENGVEILHSFPRELMVF